MNNRSNMIKKLLLIITVLLLVSSCNNKEKDGNSITYVGGEIVNPKGDYVVFYKGEQFLDSIKLDENNHFLFKAKNIKAGLYSFSHKEYQVFYLEPSDSLMLRVNTIDFDESLSYTGVGAEQNNFLMDMFLHNETEIDLMPALYKLSPIEFEKALDSLKLVRTRIYIDFVTKQNPNKTFKEIANASINYDYYSKKEIYITANERKKGSNNYFEIPESFYSYRNDIDFGSESLRSYFPYYRFLFRYFDNIALSENENLSYSNRNSFDHNYHKIELIAEIITNDSLKNSMVRNITGKYLLSCNEKEMQEKILALFLKVNSNKKHQDEINKLAEASMKLTPGNNISNLLLVTTDNTLKDLRSIIKNPTVIYLWSSNSVSHYKNIHYRVSELNSKFPEYDFIGINTDVNNANWLKIIKKYSYKKEAEYQFENLSKAEKELVIYTVNKAIIVDEKGTIINGSTNLFNINMEAVLLGYLNQ
ncbi:MAG: hypothetical protein QM499_10320 [Flavobacteriaceae bacterium]